MSQDEAFRRDILANPDDDAVRLIYADWLDEHGNRARAELIRVQCRLAQLEAIDAERIDLEDRAEELLRLHQGRWLEEIPQALRQRWELHRPGIGGTFFPDDVPQALRPSLEFRRGFVERAACSLTTWRDHIEELIAVAPIREVTFEDHPFFPADPWRHLPHIGRLRHVQLLICGEDRLAAFLGDNDLRRMESLRVAYPIPGWGDASGVFACLASAELTNLRTLSVYLADGRAKTPGLAWRQFMEGPLLPRLQSLQLSFGVDDEQMRGLFETPRLGQLRLLNLDSSGLSTEGARALARCEHLADLRSLNLSRTNIRQKGIAALVRSEYLTTLRELRLESVEFDGKIARQLLSQQRPHLASLALSHAGVSDVAVFALAETGQFPQLRRLWLSSNDKITSAGVRALAGASHLANLRWLQLSGTSVGAAGIVALGNSPHLRRLTRLSLSARALTEASATVLTASPVFRELHALEISGRVPDPVLSRLRGHFGNALSCS